MHKYFVVYKPFNVLSQFTSQEGKQTLKDFFDVPVDVYSVDRLDYDSEGLLILTNDKNVNNSVLNPLLAHEREYWIQVEGDMTNDAIIQLQQGVEINIEGKTHLTKKCFAQKIHGEPKVPKRDPPIRFRKNIADTWVKIILTEGKNRQVRKMTAKVGYPTLRLIRYRIEKLNIESLQPGEMKILSKGEMYNLLNIK